jgi:hypothetical protein
MGFIISHCTDGCVSPGAPGRTWTLQCDRSSALLQSLRLAISKRLSSMLPNSSTCLRSGKSCSTGEGPRCSVARRTDGQPPDPAYRHPRSRGSFPDMKDGVGAPARRRGAAQGAEVGSCVPALYLRCQPLAAALAARPYNGRCTIPLESSLVVNAKRGLHRSAVLLAKRSL